MREFSHGGGAGAAPWEAPEVYGELLSVAAAWSRRERDPDALEPEALVHEAWLRLTRQGLPRVDGPSHLVALATREMRRVRLDHARARRAVKRGGRDRREDLSEELPAPRGAHGEAAPNLAAILARMATDHPRWARIVALRWVAGRTVGEVARELRLSVATVEKDSRRLRAWLEGQLAR